MAEHSTESISADLPLRDPADDRLGYAPFARRLAGAIDALPPDQPLVLALHGPWGAGKTTILNFVAYYLETATPEPAAGVVEFNPWRIDRDREFHVTPGHVFLARYLRILVHDALAPAAAQQ